MISSNVSKIKCLGNRGGCRKHVRYGMGGKGGKYALEVMGTVLAGA